MKKKNGAEWFNVLLPVILVLALLISGCTGGNRSGSAEQADSEQADTKQTDAKQTDAKQASNEQAADVKGELVIWGWTDTWGQAAEEFAKAKGHDLKINYVPVEAATYIQKLQAAVAAGTQVPDVGAMEIGVRGSMLSLDIWENLDSAPYNLDRSRMLDFLVPLSTNKAGEVLGIEIAPAPAGMSYRRDLAMKYFGTDDPIELEKIFNSWDVLLEKGREVKEKSNGQDFMFTGVASLLNILMNQSTEPYVAEDGKLVISDALRPSFELAKKFLDMGLVDNIAGGSPAFNASFASGHYIFYPGPTWYFFYVIQPNDPDGQDRWNVMMPPGGPYNNGGVLFGIPKMANNKTAAWEFIQWLTLSMEGSEFIRDTWNATSAFKPSYEDSEFYSKEDEFFKIDFGKKWAELAPKVKTRDLHEDDNVLQPARNVGIELLANGSSVEEALAAIEKDIMEKLPKYNK